MRFRRVYRKRLFDLRPVARNALIESMSDGMLALDEQGRIVDLNRAAQAMLGVSMDSALGRPVTDVLVAWRELVERFRDQLVAQAEIVLERDHVPRYYDLRISPLTTPRGRVSGRLIVLREVTESKRAESALRESEARLRQITSSMREAVWLRDTRTLELLYVNPAYEAIWGRTLESFYRDPTSFLDAVHPDDKERLMAAIKQQYQGVPFDQQYRIFRPDGSLRWIWGRTFFIRNDADEVYRVMAIAEDMTERKTSEEALRRANLELQARNEELDTFGHTVAHDLKNPLSTIVGYANVLADYGDTLTREELRQAAQNIAGVGLKMNTIIEELMLLGGLRQTQVKLEPLDMASLVAQAGQSLERLIQQTRAEIVLPAESAWPAAVGYGPWVEQVWVNYLNNAIKYGGQPPRVEVGATRQNGEVRFWVRDNGDGLSSDAQARLFVPFERLDQMRSLGHGLGLSIVRRIVEKMGGRVGVDSCGEPGQGCTFSFALPAVREDDETSVA